MIMLCRIVHRQHGCRAGGHDRHHYASPDRNPPDITSLSLVFLSRGLERNLQRIGMEFLILFLVNVRVVNERRRGKMPDVERIR